MKKVIFTLSLILAMHLCDAQLINENFNSVQVNKVPTDWTVTSNTKVDNYTRPFECTTSDKGLVTPGVGQNAPSRMILPLLSFDATNNVIKISFTIWVFDANLNCSSAKNFPCPTYVSAYLIKTVSKSNKFYYSDGTTEQAINALPVASEVYASSSYQIVDANTTNTLFFRAPVIPNGASYRIYLDFKNADGSNCSSTGTKFVFDDISVSKNNCVNCAPTTNDDYFRAADNHFTNKLQANVFGGNLKWSGQILPDFQEQSLTISPAVAGGLDADLNDPDISAMEFALVPNTLKVSSGCNSTPATLSEFVLNKNGTFTINRGANVCISRVAFQYNAKNINTGKTSGNSNVIVDFTVDGVLPVHFQSFTAARNPQRKEQVLLKWATAMEENNRGFNVQRKVGGQWKTIAFVFSQADNGNSNTPLAYEYKEVNTASGISQYQIQQVDMDGTASYSDIKSVGGVDQVAAVQIYPNPAVNGKVNLVFKETNSSKDVTVNDINGRMIKQFREVRDNSLAIDGLQTGFYTIKITDRLSSETTVEKVIIK